ncbi:ferredoxin family protein [Bacteroidetes/Chlorobi group bacterium ChocPot_Mid]|jgi:2-oxoglutarate ferredoxin oxidoreductase subunit delta|nr:MAG: ferredoxin family protein [Bacteroidetes/Chlorobi group bacterium ChocPot_Mid]
MAKINKKFKLFIDEELCKGCNICVELCNLHVFDISPKINNKGYYIPVPERIEDCNGCQICELSCPELSLILEEIRL